MLNGLGWSAADMATNGACNCDFVFPEAGASVVPARDVPLSAEGNEFYVSVMLGETQILICEDQARMFVFQLHRAVMDHIKARS